MPYLASGLWDGMAVCARARQQRVKNQSMTFDLNYCFGLQSLSQRRQNTYARTQIKQASLFSFIATHTNFSFVFGKDSIVHYERKKLHSMNEDT